MRPPFSIFRFCLAITILWVIRSHSQILTPPPLDPKPLSAVEASAPESRLRQTEAIYQQQLRTRHIPVLGKYLIDLQKLALIEQDPVPIKAEMQRIQSIISSGSVIDLSEVAEELNPSPEKPAEMRPRPPGPPSTPPPGSPLKPRRGVTTLTPAFAQRILPIPEGSASPEAAAIGQIEWRIDFLPPGSYELLIQYATLPLDTDLTLTTEYAGQKITQVMEKSRATKDIKSFRLFKIGQIRLTEEFSGETLRLSAGTAETSTLLLRNFVISRVKPEP